MGAEAQAWWAGFVLSAVVLVGSLVALGLRALSDRLDALPHDVWLNVELTTDPELAP